MQPPAIMQPNRSRNNFSKIKSMTPILRYKEAKEEALLIIGERRVGHAPQDANAR